MYDSVEEMEKELTKVLNIVLVVLVTIFLIFVGYAIKDQLSKKTYCGPCKSKYDISAGYKRSAQKHVIFYSADLKRNIDVEVTNNAYANILQGELVCFTLSESQLSK